MYINYGLYFNGFANLWQLNTQLPACLLIEFCLQTPNQYHDELIYAVLRPFQRPSTRMCILKKFSAILECTVAPSGVWT